MFVVLQRCFVFKDPAEICIYVFFELLPWRGIPEFKMVLLPIGKLFSSTSLGRRFPHLMLIIFSGNGPLCAILVNSLSRKYRKWGERLGRRHSALSPILLCCLLISAIAPAWWYGWWFCRSWLQYAAFAMRGSEWMKMLCSHSLVFTCSGVTKQSSEQYLHPAAQRPCDNVASRAMNIICWTSVSPSNGQSEWSAGRSHAIKMDAAQVVAIHSMRGFGTADIPLPPFNPGALRMTTVIHVKEYRKRWEKHKRKDDRMSSHERRIEGTTASDATTSIGRWQIQQTCEFPHQMRPAWTRRASRKVSCWQTWCGLSKQQDT